MARFWLASLKARAERGTKGVHHQSTDPTSKEHNTPHITRHERHLPANSHDRSIPFHRGKKTRIHTQPDHVRGQRKHATSSFSISNRRSRQKQEGRARLWSLEARVSHHQTSSQGGHPMEDCPDDLPLHTNSPASSPSPCFFSLDLLVGLC